MIYSSIGNICPHSAHTQTPAHTRAQAAISCVVCHPWLWEALAGVRKQSALLNPLGPHVQDCMTWPSTATIQARRCCVYIPGGWARQKEQRENEGGQRVSEGPPWLWRQENLSYVSWLFAWGKKKKDHARTLYHSYFCVKTAVYPKMSKQHKNMLSDIQKCH